MKTPRPLLLLTPLISACLFWTGRSDADSPSIQGESLVSQSGTLTPGRIEGDATTGFRFVEDATKRMLPLEPGALVQGPGRVSTSASGLPPFRVEMGLGQRLVGRLEVINDREVRLSELEGGGRFTVSRGGAIAVVQRPGENLVFQDGFETIDESRWVVVGEPDVSNDPKLVGENSLSLEAGGASLTHRLDLPFASGRLELAFHDNRAIVPGQQWFVDLTFRGASGPQTVRVILGWTEESLAVESTPGSPALAVQRLARKTGWHRLGVRFSPETCEIGVDGNELAHGKGFGGPLVEVRLASFQLGKAEPPADLSGHIDDLRLVRFDNPSAEVEIDVQQDEVRLTGGDQLFGKIKQANAEKIDVTVDTRDVSLSWGEVAGLWFHRAARQGQTIDGFLVRVDWRASAGTEAQDLNSVEGALTALSPSEVTVATPYAGSLVIPRERITALRVVGKGRRILIDPMAHHLGDEISTVEPILDPPQPEGGTLERVVELDRVPEGAAFLVLDVLGVVGEAAEIPFSTLVKKGELRTNVKFNGEPFDYLNRHVVSKNETPERIRLPIPRGLLHPGRNVLRFEQAGIASDPNYLDDLGILGIALEFASVPPPR